MASDLPVAPEQLVVEFAPVHKGLLHGEPGDAAEFIAGVFEHFGQLSPQRLGALREDQAEFGQHAADAVDAGGAFLLQPFAYPVQAHDALLLGRLDRHEAHARPRGGFADRRGVRGVVLAAAAFHAVRRHEAGRDEPGIQALGPQPCGLTLTWRGP